MTQPIESNFAYLLVHKNGDDLNRKLDQVGFLNVSITGQMLWLSDELEDGRHEFTISVDRVEVREPKKRPKNDTRSR